MRAERVARLELALDEVYRWYEQVEPHLLLFARDSTLVPAYGFVTEQRADELAAVADLLMDGLPGARRYAPPWATRSTSRRGAHSLGGRG